MNQSSSIDTFGGKRLIDISNISEQTGQNNFQNSKTVRKSSKLNKDQSRELESLPEIVENSKYKDVPGQVEDRTYEEVPENLDARIRKDVSGQVGNQFREQQRGKPFISKYKNAHKFVDESCNELSGNSITLNNNDEDRSRDDEIGSTNIHNYMDATPGPSGNKSFEKVSEISISVQCKDSSFPSYKIPSEIDKRLTISHDAVEHQTDAKSQGTRVTIYARRRRNATCIALIKEDREHFRQYEEFLRRHLICEEF